MKKTLTYVAMIAFIFSIIVLVKIPIGLEYEGTWFFISIAFLIGSLILDDKIVMRGAISVSIIVLFVKIVWSPIFMSSSFIQLVEAKDSNLSSFNTKESDTRRVTLPMALQVSNKVLGTKHNGTQISSQYQIEERSASVQEVNGELLWIIPLDYSGFFKWMNLDYIPGYIKLSATNPKAKPELVLDKKIVFSMGGYFDTSIERKVWMASNLKETETHLEIDDNGKPFYVSVIIKPEIGFNADGITHVIVTDAQTGEMDKLPIEEIGIKYPWIDRVWSERIIEQRISWYGSLQDGFLNKMFVGKNVSIPTSYLNQELWLVKANSMLNWFTGMTSTNSKDQSLVSGIFVESASTEKKPILHVFDMNMVSDEAGAVSAIESSLGADSLKWSPVLPQPYIVDGEFYWTSVVVSDKSNIFQKKAYMAGDDISNVSFHSLKKANPTVDGSSSNEVGTPSYKENIMKQMLSHIEELSKLREIYQTL